MDIFDCDSDSDGNFWDLDWRSKQITQQKLIVLYFCENAVGLLYVRFLIINNFKAMNSLIVIFSHTH